MKIKLPPGEDEERGVVVERGGRLGDPREVVESGRGGMPREVGVLALMVNGVLGLPRGLPIVSGVGRCFLLVLTV